MRTALLRYSPCKYGEMLMGPESFSSWLVGIATFFYDRAGPSYAAHHVPDAQVIEGVRRLEPGARKYHVQMGANSIAVKFIVHADEEVLFVALVVEDREFRKNRESGRRGVGFDGKFPTSCRRKQVDAGRGGSECAVGVADAAVGLVIPARSGWWPRSPDWSCAILAGGAPLILRWMESSSGYLVGERLALLVGDRLASTEK